MIFFNLCNASSPKSTLMGGKRIIQKGWRLLIALTFCVNFSHAEETASSAEVKPSEAETAPVEVALKPAKPSVSFAHEVMPILTRANCAGGGCHGNRDGKGGFQLSLWGEQPAADYAALTRGARTLSEEPDKSLILRKATLETPHEGGKRFEKDSHEYQLLRQWIAEGMPNDLEGDLKASKLASLEVEPKEVILFQPEWSKQIRLRAHFEDGSVREVNHLASFEPQNTAVQVDPNGLASSDQPVETVVVARYLDRHLPVPIAFVPAKSELPWSDVAPANLIDEHLTAKYQRLGLHPSPLAEDATFLRRLYLDLTGRLPTSDEARQFLTQELPNKRAMLIDALLESDDHAAWNALLWADLLRVEERVMDAQGAKFFHEWILQSFREHKPLDVFVREILTALGSTYTQAPANYYRAIRTPQGRAEAVAQVFLGIRLQCAQCHNHPFDRWKQDDYYRFSALMESVKFTVLENKRVDINDQNMFIGEQLVELNREIKLKHPVTGKVPRPGLLDPKAPALRDDEREPLVALADWIVSPENAWFAKAQVNRIWYQMFGRGLVDPVDDLRDTNAASNPELLDALAKELISGGYDIRKIIRMIALSNTYQRDWKARPENEWDVLNFTRAEIRRLDAEPLLDSLSNFLHIPLNFRDRGDVRRAVDLPGAYTQQANRGETECDAFLTLFGKPPRLVNSDLERNRELSLTHIFTFTSGKTLNGWIQKEDNRLGKWIAEGKTPEWMFDELFLWTLNRWPHEDEKAQLFPLLQESSDRRKVLEDLAWALINSKEYILRR